MFRSGRVLFEDPDVSGVAHAGCRSTAGLEFARDGPYIEDGAVTCGEEDKLTRVPGRREGNYEMVS